MTEISETYEYNVSGTSRAVIHEKAKQLAEQYFAGDTYTLHIKIQGEPAGEEKKIWAHVTASR